MPRTGPARAADFGILAARSSACSAATKTMPAWFVAPADPIGHHGHMAGSQRSTSRPGWVRDVAVPRTLDDLNGSLTGHVGLPATVFWSGPRPRAVRWDLADANRRRDLYEIVLVEGSIDDIRALINGPALVELWDRMYLPPWVRQAWRELIDSARSAA